MDRVTTGMSAGRGGETFVLPSRRSALRTARAALGGGPVLVAGEAGVGKTWLAGRLAAETGRSLRWIAVDLGPAIDPIGLYRAMAHELGLDGPVLDRLTLKDYLAERAADGRRWGLVLDEAHLAPAETLEDVRVLSNDLGRPEGFAALVLVGQTALVRRLGLRSLAALEARLAGRVHLRPIDADEAGELIARLGPAAIDRAAADELHRAAGGNPRALLRLAAAIGPVAAVPVVERDSPLIAPPGLAKLGTERPPLHVEEGVVEVGWEPEVEPEPVAPIETATAPPEAGPVAVEDHYAALQAWEEWTRNQGRGAGEGVETEPEVETESVGELAEAGAGPAAAVLAGHPNLRVEGQQGFAPYSQLFSRLRQSEDREP